MIYFTLVEQISMFGITVGLILQYGNQPVYRIHIFGAVIIIGRIKVSGLCLSM